MHSFLFIIIADAYIIQIQKYEVNAPVTSTNAAVTQSNTNKTNTGNSTVNPLSNSTNIIRLPSSGQSIASSLANLSSVVTSLGVQKTLGLLGTNLKTNIKMAVTQAGNKTSSVVTSPKSVTQIPIQLGGQMKNQHITLAALNQLTAGKLAGTQISTAGGKTVQIISPAKSGQTVVKQQLNVKPGVNNPILSQTPISSTTATQAIKIVSTSTSSTTAAPTQYALVRAQLPSSTGGPAQTVAFIRAIGSTSTTGATGSTTVSVTPQQMAALLKGQQGGAQTQIQKVLSAAAGNQVRSPSPLNVATTLKLASQGSPSKLVSVQFPSKLTGNTSVSSLLGKVNPLTTQATTISPMGTLVSAPKPAASISLVNQFPTVRPSNATLLTKTALVAATKTTTTSSAVTTTVTPASSTTLESDNPSADSTTNDAAVEETLQNDTNHEATDNEEKQSEATIAAAESTTETDLTNDEKPLVDVPMEDEPITNTEDFKENATSTSEAEELDEKKMEVSNEQNPPIEDLTMTPDTTTSKPDVSATTAAGDVSSTPMLTDEKIKQETTDPSVESDAATTLAELASIASNTSDVDTKSTSALADISSNPLSTLAALASSSAIAPVVNGNSKIANVASLVKKVCNFFLLVNIIQNCSQDKD